MRCEGDNALAGALSDAPGHGGDGGDVDRAALVIQDAWRRRRSAASCNAASALDASRTAACCVVCLAPAADTTELERSALCTDCERRLAAADAAPTRLRRLLRVGAEVRGQLQLLRDQHRLLRLQAEQMQAARRAQAEQTQAEQARARERRRHVGALLERRRREEELKLRQFLAPEQGEDAAESASGAAKKPRKKPKAPARAMAAPPGAEDTSIAPVLASEPPALADKRADQRLRSDIQEHARLLWRRRKQTLDCYSQDLAPLADGSRPRRLPVPCELLPPAPTAKRALPSRQSGPATKSPAVAAAAGAGNRSSRPRRLKKTANVGVKLRPLATGGRSGADASDNQLDELEAARYSPSGPLTAEIKPVSWIFELGAELAPGLPPAEHSAALALHSVVEEADESGDDQAPLQARLKLYADLYGSSAARTPVGSSSSSPSLIPPLLRPLPPAVAVSSLPPTDASKPQGLPATSQAPAQWEYSTERLAGLLEKYNVSVKDARA